MPALEGMRVLDMTQYEAGTSCTQLLAWLGADVVKVERPGMGDPGRELTPHHGRDRSQYFLNYNSNKRSTVINLATARGRELLLDLASHYDVFIENYGPGVIEKLDIGFEVLKEQNPSIIYARIKGFGLSGPYAHYKCYDNVAQAAAGAFSVNGLPGGPPVRPGASFADSGTGVQTALAITAAYVRKLQTGEGAFIEMSMQEAMTLFMRSVGTDVWGREPAGRRGNLSRPPTNLYPCTPGGPNDYVYIMTITSRMWDTLCAAIGMPEMTVDERFATPEARLDHKDELFDEIANWTRERTKYQAMEELAEAGVPCSAVLDTLDLWNDPHLRARGLIETVEHPVYETVELMRSPIRISGNEVPLRAAPLLGAHTDEVLRGDLGLNDATIEGLREAGEIA